jgi:hypothetical protein
MSAQVGPPSLSKMKKEEAVNSNPPVALSLSSLNYFSTLLAFALIRCFFVHVAANSMPVIDKELPTEKAISKGCNVSLPALNAIRFQRAGSFRTICAELTGIHFLIYAGYVFD